MTRTPNTKQVKQLRCCVHLKGERIARANLLSRCAGFVGRLSGIDGGS